MPTLVNCPDCRRELRVPDHLRGKEVQCPTCGARFAAAGPEAAEGQAAPTEIFREPALPGREDPPRPRPSLVEDEDDPYYAQGRLSGHRLDLDPHRGRLILTLGILGVVLVPCGAILGPLAWILGQKDLAAMHAGTMDPRGRADTNAGRILGMIASFLSLAVCLFYAMLCGGFGAGFVRFRV